MTNIYGHMGIWKIETYRNKKLIKTEEIRNRIMNAALDELLKPLQGLATDIEVKYIALGTGDTPITNTQTQLQTEIFRTTATTTEKTNVGELTNVFFVLDSEAVGHIKEIGLFGGTGATSAANSGLLISRILWDKVKVLGEEIRFTRIDKITRS